MPTTARFTVAVVARRLGIAPATLRTWDRRYGLGPSNHESGTRRRYTAADLARLQHMRRLTLEGVAPAEAARLALVDEPDASATGPAAARGTAPGREHRESGARSGGRVLAMPGAAATARGLARAAMALDAPAVSSILQRALDEDGVPAMWESLLRPVLQAAGRRWEQTGEGVEVEHLLAECAIGVLRAAGTRAKEPMRHRPILLACAPGEYHSLPLYALAATLADAGFASRILGPDVPIGALGSATRRLGPAAVFVYALMPVADGTTLSALPATRPRTAVIAGGPGWAASATTPQSGVAQSLLEARTAVIRAVSA